MGMDTQYTAWLHSTYMHRWSFCFVWVRVSGTWSGSSVAFLLFYIITIHGRAVYDWSSFFPHVYVCIPWVVVLGNGAFTGAEAPVSTSVIVYSS
ncbi:hypothetical protein F5144DRAFT_204980 [Chaetomium tenue]|uniref:Uncharacterized protein n=1 Tax=Chaetomium tenue TaxID=1854479 RepID=A0ACB7PD97_9PEZI|nr:hypothetical protein F5144DRAFT_204980 [Chaetomium globosum]